MCLCTAFREIRLRDNAGLKRWISRTLSSRITIMSAAGTFPTRTQRMRHSSHSVSDLLHHKRTGLGGPKELRNARKQRGNCLFLPQITPFCSCSPTPVACTSANSTPPLVPVQAAMVADVGEQLDSDYQVHDLPTSDDISESSITATPSCSTELVVNAALLARIETLERDNRVLTNKLQVAMDQRALSKLLGMTSLLNCTRAFRHMISYYIFLIFWVQL